MIKADILEPAYPSSMEDRKVINENLFNLGFELNSSIVKRDNLFDKWAGTPSERLSDFYSSWNSDSGVLLCSKGGSGISHFISLIDSKKLKKNKIFLGYSDITMLLNLITFKKKIVTFHGPNMSKKLDKTSLLALKDAIQMKNYGIKFSKKQRISSLGKISGLTVGGNLDRLVELLHWVKLDFKDKIVFLEEVWFSEYKIFNLLCTLKNYPSFKPKAILFGNLGVKNKKLMGKMIKYLFPNTPVVIDLPFGHQTSNITVPIGAECEIDFKFGKVNFRFNKEQKKYAIN